MISHGVCPTLMQKINKPNWFNCRCVPGGLWLEGIDSALTVLTHCLSLGSSKAEPERRIHYK